MQENENERTKKRNATNSFYKHCLATTMLLRLQDNAVQQKKER